MAAKFEDIEMAFTLVSAGNFGDCLAYVDPETGNVYYETDVVDIEESQQLTDDINIDQLIEVPNKHDLDLGRTLAIDFAEQFIPQHYDDVYVMFKRRGAFGHFKNLLQQLGYLDKWHAFEEEKTTQALRDWCEENSIRLID